MHLHSNLKVINKLKGHKKANDINKTPLRAYYFYCQLISIGHFVDFPDNKALYLGGGMETEMVLLEDVSIVTE